MEAEIRLMDILDDAKIPSPRNITDVRKNFGLNTTPIIANA